MTSFIASPKDLVPSIIAWNILTNPFCKILAVEFASSISVFKSACATACAFNTSN